MRKIMHYIIGCCVLLCMGCADWLDVKPNDRLEQEEMFSTEDGFKNALTGIYIDLKSDVLYGKNMTMGFVENLAQHWDVSAETVEDYTCKYDFENSQVEALVKDIYAKYYNVILNINNLLNFVDNGVLSEDVYCLIKGEALALRAFLHLDILRLFGPIPGEQNDSKILVYSRVVSRDYQPMVSWAEYIVFLREDLNAAENLLKKVEEKGIHDDFFAYRENRLNYWAILALQARYYLWIQNKEKAAEYAKLLIANKRFRLSNETDLVKKDLIGTSELLFAVHVYNLEEKVMQYFFRGGGVKKDMKKVQNDLFENDVTDNRRKYLWNEIKNETTPRYTLFKYQQEGIAGNSAEQIPLIRLYEMYLIAIECNDDLAECKQLVEELVVARNISVLNVDNLDKKNEFVGKEYQKEFYGEGQTFFYCKRKAMKEILWTDKEGGKDLYVLPLPKTEIKYEY